MSYQSHDEIYNNLLTDYRLKTPEALDAELQVRAAGLASALWGLYRQADDVEDQIFPDTARDGNKVHHGDLRGLSLAPGETMANLLERILSRLRNPPAAGNRTDFDEWATGFSYGSKTISKAKTFANGYGPGTIVVVAQSIVGSTSDNSDILSALKSDLLDRGPLGPAAVYCIEPPLMPISISIQITGGDASKAQDLIASFMAGVSAGQQVYPLAFDAFCYQAGASVVSRLLPASNSVIVPDRFGLVQAASIVVARVA